jgi:hypothetical protein
VREDLVDDADAVEHHHDRQPARDRGGLVAALVLQPANVPFDVRLHGGQRIDRLAGTPAQEDPQIRLGMHPGLPAVTAQVGGHRSPQDR